MTVIVCMTSKSTYKIRKNEIFIGTCHDKQVLYSVQTLYLQGFAGISKKFVINTIKQLTTVQYCYTLFADGRDKPVTRSSGIKGPARRRRE